MTDQPTPEARAEATIEALDDILSGHGTEGAGDIIDRLANLARAAIRERDEAREAAEEWRETARAAGWHFEPNTVEAWRLPWEAP